MKKDFLSLEELKEKNCNHPLHIFSQGRHFYGLSACLKSLVDGKVYRDFDKQFRLVTVEGVLFFNYSSYGPEGSWIASETDNGWE